jgi:CBS domain-containing protein
VKNSEAFLDAFTRIEKHLRRASNARSWMPFTQLVSRAARFMPEIRRFQIDLKEFADLRNAIVHGRMNDEVIAEPNDWAVSSIVRMAEVLTAPPAVVPLFAKKVFTIGSQKTMAEALRLMKSHDFSKLPVIGLHHEWRGLLTANIVTRWLAANVDGGVVDLGDQTVEDALHFAESGTETFVAPTATVFDVYDLFHGVESRGKSLEAIIITEDGRASDRLLGLITVADLPKILPHVEIGRVQIREE